MSKIAGRWRRLKRTLQRTKSRVDDAVFEYGPVVIIAGAIAAYFTWGQSWLR